MESSRLTIAIIVALCVATSPGYILAESQQSTELKPVDTANLIEANELILALADQGSVSSDNSSRDQEMVPVPLPGVFTLEEALQRAIDDHPGLAALEKEYLALDSLAWQEGRRPNPELEFEIGDFAGTGESGGLNTVATSVTYTQPIERGGKREKRQTAASLERELVYWDINELEYEIHTSVRLAYRQVQVAEYECAQLEQYDELFNTVRQTIAAGVEAGRNPRLELEKVEIELAALELEKSRARRGLDLARTELAAAMGETEVTFSGLPVLDGTPPGLPAIEVLEPLLDHHPALARYDAEYQALCAQVDLENAGAVPDISVFGGITRLEESSEAVFNVGLALDLPWNDRNEGNISAAGYRLARLEDDLAATRRAFATQLMVMHRAAADSWANQASYEVDLLPAAGEVLSLTEEGYNYGKFGVMDVLDAQHTLLELKVERSAALVEYFTALAELESLVNLDLFNGSDLPSTDNNGNTDLPEAGTTSNQEHTHADH